MPLTPNKLRSILRWVHLVIGAILLCYVYSPFGQNVLFQWVVKIFLIPILVISGFGLWKFPVFNRLFGIK